MSTFHFPLVMVAFTCVVLCMGTDACVADRDRCNTCLGTGRCRMCSGSGRIRCSSCGGTGHGVHAYADEPASADCGFCHGTGTRRCFQCNGSGRCKHCLGGYHYSSGTSPTPTVVSVPMTAVVRRVAIKHGVTKDGERGIQMTVAFEILNATGVPCTVAAAFASHDGKLLPDTDGRCAAPWGNVAVERSFQPAHFHAVYTDAPLFVPYSQLHLRRGRHRLRMIVGLVGPGQEVIALSPTLSFRVRQSK